ncbi:MAG: type II secretion system F family protein [Acidimicrobiales bacterium]
MVIVLAVLLLVGGTALALFGLNQRQLETAPDDAGEYLRSLDRDDEETDEFQRLLAEPFLTRVIRPVAGGLLSLLGGVLPRNYRERIHTALLHAGIAGQFRAEEIISLQVLGGIVGFLLGAFIVSSGTLGGGAGILVLVLLPIFGAQSPKSWLDRKVQDRKEAILRDLPDTLDLMAISVEAGMGFEGAIGVVCDNFASPLADEFARTLREMELGLPRREALHNLKKRTEVPELSNFVLTLTQADALGMPVGRVLKTSAGEMRSKRQQWAREKAAKLPVKILFPLILFIFPAIFVVLLGPAASDIGGAFGG